jgi:hypothetical protein
LAAGEKPRHLFLISADSLKLGLSNAFVIDEAQLEFKMNTQSLLQKISTAISLFGMSWQQRFESPVNSPV